MKIIGLPFFLVLLSLFSAQADLTIVQKVEGVGPLTEMTMKIKGDKIRVDMNPQLTTIFDGKTGEVIQLMKNQKAVVRMSAEKMKAAAEMMKKYSGQTEPAVQPKLAATGKKETINGYETEEYVADTGTLKVSYWIAPKYPDSAAILKQLQALSSASKAQNNMGIPDYRDLPGLPIKSVVSTGGMQMITTLVSVKQDPLNDADFAVPKDFKEMEMPEIGKMMQQEPKAPAAGASPQP